MPQVIHAAQSLQEVGFTQYFVLSNGQCPCSASQQPCIPLKEEASSPFAKTRREHSQTAGAGWDRAPGHQSGSAGASLSPAPFPSSPHRCRHRSAPAQPPGSSQETSWEGQIQHMGFPGTAWIRGIHPFAALTTPNRQSHNIPIVHPGQKQPQSGHKRKKKICMGTHGPTCALSGLQYCQERRGTWPKSLSTATKVLKAQL